MMYKFFGCTLGLLATLHSGLAQGAMNVALFGQVNRGDTRYSGSWSYVAPDGSEYALIGARTGTAVYQIDDPVQLTEVGFVAGPVTNWREITTIGQFAYVVTDVQGTGHGMQVMDLGFLPDSVHLVTNYTATFTKGHIIQKAIDSDDTYVYVAGTSTTQGVHILDVSDPADPQEIGVYAPGYYIHDCHVRGGLLFGAAFYQREVDIVDISDKTNPVLVGKITYDGKNTHSASTTEDGKFLFLADEADGYPGRVFNIEDIGNPVEVAQFTANFASLVHNPYVKGDYCYVSHNTEGLRVLDIADPALPVEVGFYDTWDGPSGGFNGLWSACPYFPSGKIIGGNRHDGLYVWTFNNTKAARIYGVVKDSLTGLPVVGASVEISGLSDTLRTNLSGNFKKGMLAGAYHLRVAMEGYLPKTVEAGLSQGDTVWAEILLRQEGLSGSGNLLKERAAFLVYPNPSSGEVQIDFGGMEKAVSLKVFNQQGKLLTTFPVDGKKQMKVQLAVLENGPYFLSVFNLDGELIGTSKVQMF